MALSCAKEPKLPDLELSASARLFPSTFTFTFLQMALIEVRTPRRPAQPASQSSRLSRTIVSGAKVRHGLCAHKNYSHPVFAVRVKCSPDDTVGDLKKLIAAQTGTDHTKIQLKKWCVCILLSFLRLASRAFVLDSPTTAGTLSTRTTSHCPTTRSTMG